MGHAPPRSGLPPETHIERASRHYALGRISLEDFEDLTADLLASGRADTIAPPLPPAPPRMGR